GVRFAFRNDSSRSRPVSPLVRQGEVDLRILTASPTNETLDGMWVSVGQATTLRGLKQKLEEWFPDREFFMRSQGQVRFITISSRMQKAAAALVAGVILIWVTSLAVAAILQIQAKLEVASLLDREAQVASAESRVAAYRDDIGDVAEDLARRQAFLEDMTEMLPADVTDDATVDRKSVV